MLLFPPKIEIGETEGFTKEKDIFNRAPQGDGLLNLVTVIEEPIVIAVDGPWGSGKTTFLKMWPAATERGVSRRLLRCLPKRLHG